MPILTFVTAAMSRVRYKEGGTKTTAAMRSPVRGYAMLLRTRDGALLAFKTTYLAYQLGTRPYLHSYLQLPPLVPRSTSGTLWYLEVPR
eukprot:1129408-Rhodomonas_salina.1